MTDIWVSRVIWILQFIHYESNQNLQNFNNFWNLKLLGDKLAWAGSKGLKFYNKALEMCVYVNGHDSLCLDDEFWLYFSLLSYFFLSLLHCHAVGLTSFFCWVSETLLKITLMIIPFNFGLHRIFFHSTMIISTFRSGDSTARIWTIAEGRCKPGSQNSPLNVLVLKHVRGKTNEKSKDVTTLDWNVSSVAYNDFKLNLNPRQLLVFLCLIPKLYFVFTVIV